MNNFNMVPSVLNLLYSRNFFFLTDVAVFITFLSSLFLKTCNLNMVREDCRDKELSVSDNNQPYCS